MHNRLASLIWGKAIDATYGKGADVWPAWMTEPFIVLR